MNLNTIPKLLRLNILKCWERLKFLMTFRLCEKPNVMEGSEKPKPKSKSEMSKIQVLRLTQKYYAAVGIEDSLVDQPYPLNERILLGFLTVIPSFFFNLMFILSAKPKHLLNTFNPVICFRSRL